MNSARNQDKPSPTGTKMISSTWTASAPFDNDGARVSVSVSSTWNGSPPYDNGGSPPKSRLEMKMKKRIWLRDIAAAMDSQDTHAHATMNTVINVNVGVGVDVGVDVNKHTEVRNEVVSCSTNESSVAGSTPEVTSANLQSSQPPSLVFQRVSHGAPTLDPEPKAGTNEIIPRKKYKEYKDDIRTKTKPEPIRSTAKSDTRRITIRKSEKKPEAIGAVDTSPSYPYEFVGGGIADKVKLSRRRAAVKNMNIEQSSPVQSKPKPKSAVSKHKPAADAHYSKKEDHVVVKKKHPLRISLKMNLGKRKISTEDQQASGSVGASGGIAVVQRVQKKKPPVVVQIRRKKKKIHVSHSASSSSDSDSDDDSSSGSDSSGSGSDSSSSGSSGSDSDSSSDSDSGSGSSSSSGSSDDSSSSESDSDNDSSPAELKATKHEKIKTMQKIIKANKAPKLKVRGKQQSKASLQTRESEKSEIEKAENTPQNVPKSRPLTAAELRAILAADDDNSGVSSSWVRRSTRQPSWSGISAPNVRALVGKLEMNDLDMIVLKCKKYLGDPDTPSVIVDAMLDALEKNTNCQALYIQNFNVGMCDEQVLHLLRILQLPTCKIWCLNIGETYNVKRKTWAQFTNGLQKTKITHMYASEHTISSAMKEKIRETVRNNRQKHDMHINPNNLDVIVQCTHCWWNPINARVLHPYVKQRGYEHILLDKIAQGAKDVMVTDSSKI